MVTNALAGLTAAGFMEWSRTGSRVGYRSLNNHLFTVDVDLGVGSNQQVSFDSYDQRSPSWSPDDRFIVYRQFVSYATKGKDTIRRFDVATGVTSLLVSQSNANLGSPDWRRF